MGNLLYNNPRMLVLLIGIIAVAGVTSYTTMPRMEDPILVQRFGIVRTIFPGADAERVESQVSRPLEEDIWRVTGVKEVTSESMAGVSTISIELKEEITDVDTIWSRIRDEVAETAKTLPDGVREPDFVQPELRAYASIIALKWTAPGEANLAILGRLAKDLKGAIRSLDGTKKVELFGEPEEEILVEVPEETLHQLGLTVGDLSRQISESETKGSAGLFRGGQSDLVIEVDEDLDSVTRIGKTPIRHGPRGQLSNLGDISSISKRHKSPPSIVAIVDGKDAVVCGAFVRDENRIDLWNKKLNKTLDDFRASLPDEIKLDVLFSQNVYVQDRLVQLAGNLLIGTLAVIVVVFILMGWRSMIVVGSALPLSALMVITGMRFLGIPIHQMSVTGLIIALGLLIDNAIVMVDEVRAEIREGKTCGEAIRKTIRHLALPLFGSTLTTTLAFTPIALLPGTSGEFVGSIAVSVILAINASFLLAMTVVPALTALLGGPNRVRPSTQQGTAGNSTGYGFWTHGISNAHLANAYRWALVKLFRVPVVGVLLGVVLPIVGFYQMKSLPEQFFPPASRDQIHIELELPAFSSIQRTREMALEVRESVLEETDVSRVHWFLGRSSPSFYYNLVARRKFAPFYGHALVVLDEGAPSREIIHRLQEKLDREFPEGRVLVRQLEQGPPFDAPVEVRVFGPDIAVLQQLGEKIRLVMSETGDVLHTRSDLNEVVPKLALRLDEFEARSAGLTHKEIENQLYSSLEGLESGTLVETTEDLPVRVRTVGLTRASSAQIESFELRPLTPRGRAAQGIPLSAVGNLNLDSEVAGITRINGRRVNEVKAYITAGVLPHMVLTEFKERLAESEIHLPEGYEIRYAGESAERDEAVGNLMAGIPLLVALMIATLVAAFRSFRVALIIAMVGGLSIGLGLGALWLFGFPFGFMGVVGTMGLVGVAVNDAIVVMAGVRDDERARRGLPDAVAGIVIRRTRHIVATSLTTMAGFTPLVLDRDSFWPPVAITIAGGVAGATLLALFFVPSMYLLFIGRAVWLDSDLDEAEQPRGGDDGDFPPPEIRPRGGGGSEGKSVYNSPPPRPRPPNRRRKRRKLAKKPKKPF